MSSLRAGGILAVFVTVTLILIPLQWLLVKLDLPLKRRLPYRYHRFVCRLFGIKLHVIGEPLQGGVLMTANHNGWMDIPILSAVAPVSFVAKTEVNSWPFFGTLARLQRTVFVRRERARALEDRDTIRRRLGEGDALLLFPEGTSSDGNRVLSFKSALLGAAEIMIGDSTHHVPVQPVSVAYVRLHGIPMGREMRPFFAWYGDMDLAPHLWTALETGPIDVVVEFFPPVTIDSAGGRKQLAAICEEKVREGLIRALTGRAGAHAVTAHHDEELAEALAEDGETETEEAA